MLKEIYEQSRAIKDTLSGRLAADNSRVVLNEINALEKQLRETEKIFIAACGTAYHAGLVGKHIIESQARIPVEVDIASEFRYRKPLLEKNTLVIVISQSGETADTSAVLREAKHQGVPVLAVTNVVGSSVAREADSVIYTLAGPEIAVASTKAYTTQLVSMYLLALYLAQQRRSMNADQITEIICGLRELPDKVNAVLKNDSYIKTLVQKYGDCNRVFFIGRGLDHAVAKEGALKLKEISYLHAEAYAAGELKYGTMALITKKVPVIALATQPALFESMLSDIKEVKARDARVLAVTMQNTKEFERETDQTIYLPSTHHLLAPVLAVIPLQLFAYHMAVARGCDVDQPRNLAKSVTVE